MAFFILLAHANAPSLTGWDGIVEGDGIAVALTGMSIVFAALTLIAVLIALVPHLLAFLAPILPKIHPHHEPPSRAEQTSVDRDKIVAAIGLVLHTEMQKVTSKS